MNHYDSNYAANLDRDDEGSPQGVPVGRAALKHIMDTLALASLGRAEELSVTIDCGGYEEYIGVDVVNRAVVELEAMIPRGSYSDDVPTVAGRYWMRLKADHSRKTVWSVTAEDVANPPIWFKLNQFRGPLEEPL